MRPDRKLQAEWDRTLRRIDDTERNRTRTRRAATAKRRKAAKQRRADQRAWLRLEQASRSGHGRIFTASTPGFVTRNGDDTTVGQVDREGVTG